MKYQRLLFSVVIFIAAMSGYAASDQPGFGRFGPVGFSFHIVDGKALQVENVHKGSPAAGVIFPGDVITAINGKAVILKKDEGILFGHFKRLASFIASAESTDGTLTFTLRSHDDEPAKDVVVQLPVLGRYDEGTLEGDKADMIIRQNADAVRDAFIWEKPVGRGKNRRFIEINTLAEVQLINGYAMLMLLSTGDGSDLEFVRSALQRKMFDFNSEEISSNMWNNGVFGIAVCEYYLRTGDESVMPLINAICEAGRKYETHGGWTQRAKGIRPQYGLVNAAGTQMLTTLLLAKQCGADVDQKTLNKSVRFFYRFVGHGNSPYGDNRPELGLINNGKNAMLSIAMGQAARSNSGEVYSLARDKAALTSLHTYPVMLKGHSGPYGLLWYGISAAFFKEIQPELYSQWVDQTRWFYELSRRHDGLFSPCLKGRFGSTRYGYAVGLALTASRKTLQITGAPTSPYAKKFSLPTRPWGRKSDVAFHTVSTPDNDEKTGLAPHTQWQNMENAGEAELRTLASHPVQAYRDRVAYFIREKGLMALTEELLESDDPLARNTACTVINYYEPRNKLVSIGTRARYSLSPAQFSDRMFQGLAAMLTDKAEPLWNVDRALVALAAATPEQVVSQLNRIIPWLYHDEWWLQEAACIALTPAFRDETVVAEILPHMVKAISGTLHARARKHMSFFLNRAVKGAGDDVRDQVGYAFVEIAENIPSIKDPEPGVDYSGITSCALLGALQQMIARHGMVLEAAWLGGQRIHEMRHREQLILLEMIMKASAYVPDQESKEIADILRRQFRPVLFGADMASFRKSVYSRSGANNKRLDAILKIDRMHGSENGWKVFGNNASGKQEWWATSCPFGKLPTTALFKKPGTIILPFELENWYKPEYAPYLYGWMNGTNTIGETVPDTRRPEDIWYEDLFSPNGELMLMRKEFFLSDFNFALMRVTLFTNGGFEVYLNGHKIKKSAVSIQHWDARRFYLTGKALQHLRYGRNVIAVQSILKPSKRPFGFDFYLETLKSLPEISQ